MREVAAELERPVLLFSGGKDSIVLLRLAEKAFRPGAFPFPVLHVDTGHNFPEVIEFRDRLIERARRAADRRLGAGGDRRRAREGGGPVAQPAADRGAARGDRGAALRRRVRRRPPRRGARPREGARVLVPRRVRPVGPARPAARGLEPLQRPRPRAASSVRVFPLSNWTELDVWHYIQREELELPSIYFAHERRVFERDGMLLAESEWLEPERRRGGLRDEGPLPHGRRHDRDRRGAQRGDRPRGRDRRDRRPPPSPSAARRAPTTASPPPRWKTASARATSRWTCCASPPPARSTTASRR